MKNQKIYRPNSKEHYRISTVEDFEYVNPLEYIFKSSKHALYFQFKEFYEKKGLNPIQIALLIDLEARKIMSEILAAEPPEILFSLFEDKSKKEQIKILRGISLTSYELICFIFKAHKKFGYTYSQYKAEHLPNGFEGKRLPNLGGIKDNGEIESIGETDLSLGEIKSIINQRNVVVAKFLDKGNEWHCFFLTYRSIRGEEADPPHLHYISNNWGLSRTQVLEKLKSKRYSLPSLPHINFNRQSDKE